MKAILGNLFNAIMAISLAVMAILVFVNVILRYVFSSGFAWSVELGQILFVVVVFLGAIAAFKDNNHIKVDLLYNKLSPLGKKITFITGNLVMLYLMWIFFNGSWKLVQNNFIMKTPGLGLPVSYIYSLGMITSLAIGLIILFNIFQTLKKSNDS